ncbi:MAG: C4-dicarboxylate ABC transporter substrate-binding protein, partial [Pseudomonadota bacterium]
MKLRHLVSALVAATAMSTASTAEVNLSAVSASPGGSTHLSPSHLVEIAGKRGIANIQLADGQTLTNSIQNVAEGKTDIAASPHIL